MLRRGPLLLLLVAGCLPGYARISVRAGPDINERRPLYMLVRAVERKVYLSESYQTVSGKVVEADASVLAARMIYPGEEVRLCVRTPKKGGVALYFLFTRPDPSWRMFLEPPVPYRVDVALAGSGIRQEP